MCITAPIAWPVSKVLDHTLGTKHSSLFRRRGLKALVEVHGAEGGLGGNLTSNEIHVIQHALDLTSKCGQSSGAYTPLDQVLPSLPSFATGSLNLLRVRGEGLNLYADRTTVCCPTLYYLYCAEVSCV